MGRGTKCNQNERIIVTVTCKNTPKYHKTTAKTGHNEKKNTPFLLSRSSKKRYGGAGFTPRVGGAPGPRQLLEFGGRPPITDL